MAYEPDGMEVLIGPVYELELAKIGQQFGVEPSTVSMIHRQNRDFSKQAPSFRSVVIRHLV